MLEFVIGVMLGLIFAGSLGFTKDDSIRSEKPFEVDNLVYQCKYIGVRK